MKSKTAVFQGSFDPITVGHVEIIKRAAKLFDRVIVAVADNEDKEYMFSRDERLAMVKAGIDGITGVDALPCGGYVADLALQHGAVAFVRGIRNGTDAEYERVGADFNLNRAGIETLLMYSGEEYGNISSTMVRGAIEMGNFKLGMPNEKVSELARRFYTAPQEKIQK